MTVASGVGSLPGDDARDYTEAVRLVLGELPDLPHVPELPGRGPGADLVGRTLAMVTDLGADLQPAGWRLTDAEGVDQRRARSLLAQDLDTVEELTQGLSGPLKVQVAGPWTLASMVEKPRGDRVLADHGARRELAEALAEGVAAHVADVRRRVPGADLVVQVDEPALPGVLAGRVPTASGFGRHRSVDAPGASALLEVVFGAITNAGAEPIAHCCAASPPIALLAGAGARGISVDLSLLDATAYDALAARMEAGDRVLLGVLPSVEPATPPSDSAVTGRVLRLMEMVGIDPVGLGDRLGVTPACGMAGASPVWVRRVLEQLRRVARQVTDRD